MSKLDVDTVETLIDSIPEICESSRTGIKKLVSYLHGISIPEFPPLLAGERYEFRTLKGSVGVFLCIGNTTDKKLAFVNEHGLLYNNVWNSEWSWQEVLNRTFGIRLILQARVK